MDVIRPHNVPQYNCLCMHRAFLVEIPLLAVCYGKVCLSSTSLMLSCLSMISFGFTNFLEKHTKPIAALEKRLHNFTLIDCHHTVLFHLCTLFELDPNPRIILNLLDHFSVPANDDTDSKSGHDHLDDQDRETKSEKIKHSLV